MVRRTGETEKKDDGHDEQGRREIGWEEEEDDAEEAKRDWKRRGGGANRHQSVALSATSNAVLKHPTQTCRSVAKLQHQAWQGQRASECHHGNALVHSDRLLEVSFLRLLVVERQAFLPVLLTAARPASAPMISR
eukprot:34671-Rhodomonas_salina.5